MHSVTLSQYKLTFTPGIYHDRALSLGDMR